MKKIEAVKLIKIVRSAAIKGLPAVPHSTPCTARKICGPTVWNNLTKGQRINAGHVLRAIVALGYIELNAAGTSSSNHLLYVLA
jgi:hypothetical protein